MEPFVRLVNEAGSKLALLKDHDNQIEHIYQKLQDKVSV